MLLTTSSIIVLVVSVVLPMLAGLWVLSTSPIRSTLFNNIKSYFSLPALFEGRSAQALPLNIGYVPDRSTSTVIFIYVALNIIFSSVSYHSVQPSSWFSNRNQEMAAYVGNRTGVLSFANMALAMLFSARNNPLLYFSGWSQNTFIALHRWAARVAVIQAIIHSVAYTADYVSYMDTNMFATEAAMPYFWWGIIGTTAMGLMAGLSILPLRKWSYELFLVLHIALAIISLLGCWYHVDLRFKKNWGYEVWLYLAFAFWAYDRLVRFGKLTFFSFLGGTSHGQVEAIPGTDNIVSLKLYPSRTWRAGPGQHSFLYFPGLGRFWENHPFTIAGWGVDGPSHGTISETSSTSEQQHSEKGPVVSARAVGRQPLYLDSFYVRFIFRAHTGTTAKLYNGLAGGPQAPTVLSEGAYGGHSPVNKSILKYAENIVIVAGGIGITFAVGFVQQFAQEQAHRGGALMPRCQRLLLAWSVRERGLLEYVRREVLPQAGVSAGRVPEYRFWLTGEGAGKSGSSQVVAGHRMDIAETLGAGLDKSKKNLILVCGPGGMADDVRREVVRCSKQGFDVQLWEESFTW
jgi:predicted ferric reductase